MNRLRAEKVEQFLILESLGEPPQALGDARIARFNEVDLREQLIEIRGDDGITHRIDEFVWPVRERFVCQLRRFVFSGGGGVLGVPVFDSDKGMDLLKQLDFPKG